MALLDELAKKAKQNELMQRQRDNEIVAHLESSYNARLTSVIEELYAYIVFCCEKAVLGQRDKHVHTEVYDGFSTRQFKLHIGLGIVISNKPQDFRPVFQEPTMICPNVLWNQECEGWLYTRVTVIDKLQLNEIQLLLKQKCKKEDINIVAFHSDGYCHVFGKDACQLSFKMKY